MKVRFAISPGGRSFDAGQFVRFVRGLEERRFDTVWLSDVPLAPTIEPLVGLTFAAAQTTRLKLGANIVPLGHHPMVLAQQLAQLDHLSNGRLLLTVVPGIGSPKEREVLGITDRAAALEEAVTLWRQWWSGERVEHHSERWSFSGVSIEPRPVQSPLELWFGGLGPKALERAGRLADGWLGAALTPTEAQAARERIQASAATAGREIDPEHFGMSIGYARKAPSDAVLAALRERRPDLDPTELIPVGGGALEDLLGRYADAGCSKFVLRPIEPAPASTSTSTSTTGDEELDWLAALVLPLQT